MADMRISGGSDRNIIFFGDLKR